MATGVPVAVTAAAPGTAAQTAPAQPRTVFGNGVPFEPSDLPPCALRRELEALSPGARAFAMTRLGRGSFHINDLASLHVDRSGMPYYVCSFSNATEAAGSQDGGSTGKPEARGGANIPLGDGSFSAQGSTETIPSLPGPLAAVPVSSPPIRHSKPGSSRVLYLDFNGGVITNTQWNTDPGYRVARWDCLPFDIDGNTNTFSDAEQAVIISTWERVAEDYAPFDIDVTTEQPAAWTMNTAHALITPVVDAKGTNCPHFGFGGIAYVDIFGQTGCSYNDPNCYSPAWITPQSGSSYSYTAEAASHEVGHNMGLHHDGTTAGVEYYGGHGSGDISWSTIMGTGYGENVTQWSKGEYYKANNTNEDDLAIISAKTTYRADDYGNTNSTATGLSLTNGTALVASGIIESNTDVDVFAFACGAGAISLTVFPYRCSAGTYGGNLDVNARLYNSSGTLVASSNPPTATFSIINYTAPAEGAYYLHVGNSGAGNPTNASPTGYTAYGSLGQYTVSGRVTRLGGVVVTVPNGGETWYKGQTNAIFWTSGTNLSGPVRIELRKGGYVACTITNSVTNSGSVAWTIPIPLPSAASYTVRVCSTVQTSLWDMSDAPFSLALTPARLLFENFDASGALPAGWSTSNLVGGTSWTLQNGGYGGHPASAYSGTNNACLYVPSTFSNVCMLTTPSIPLAGTTGSVLRFRHAMEAWLGDQDELRVRIRTNASETWSEIAVYTNSLASWTQQTVPIPGSPTNLTIGFVGTGKYGYGVCLDDVAVDGYAADITLVTNNTPVSWLESYGLELTDDAALGDADGDGMPAWQEWIAGTIPTQAVSVLRVSNSWSEAGGRVLGWGVVSGRTYSVNWSSNLALSAFGPLVTSNTTGVYTDAVHAADQAGFYRIGVQLKP